MKKGIVCFISLALCFVLLASCGYEKRIIGTWVGEGYFESHGEEVPFEYVEELSFAEDGSGYALGDGRYVNFTYKLTDDTLTLVFEEIELAWGKSYQINNDTLTVGASVFKKTN